MTNFTLSKASNENHLSVPGSLDDFAGWQSSNVQLFVSVSNVSASCDQLLVDESGDSLDSKYVVSENETLKHVHLCSSHFIVAVLLIPDSKNKSLVIHQSSNLPVLVKPVVGFGLSIEGISKV